MVSLNIYIYPLSSDNGRLEMTRSGTSCEVVVKNAMHKDNGTWRFQIGTGDNWNEMKQELFLYNVFVEGTSILNLFC